ncbi:hypothetical protein EKH57_05665 [Halorubrum sp. BOL3-1]|uniref:hypothetical protein n=1 Tax=Halorubrum sp. BOL3-1 TaxID=2497325 RepID=UPI0010051E0C|nr:hypothetical protein [Halorubrum sp. BOL3-1]QAU12245.1 hypothetical protein EKH57_05665 [Halorubrum sp. BOL3-1]
MDKEAPSSTDPASPETTTLARAAQRSRLSGLWRAVTGAIRSSYLYRWLTAEPDPDVIVIDLRETWTVGPVIRLLDAVVDRVWPALDDSRVASVVRAGVSHTRDAPAAVSGLMVMIVGLLAGLATIATQGVSTTSLAVAVVALIAGAVATRERRSWDQLRETRPVKLLIAALEPPAPPDQDDSDPPADTPADDSQTTDEPTETNHDATSDDDDTPNP